jgi:hypothetical protein
MLMKIDYNKIRLGTFETFYEVLWITNICMALLRFVYKKCSNPEDDYALIETRYSKNTDSD